MKVAKIYFEGVSPYQQGRHHETPKLKGELPDDWEKRTWAERSHVDEHGEIIIPANSIKNCISEAAKFLNLQVPGKGKTTFTKHFEAGILCIDHVPLGIKKADAVRVGVFGNAQGKRGQPGGRVWKYFPTIQKWSGMMTVYILDDIITNDVFEQVLIGAGKFIGLGVYRPRNSGTNGRFEVKKIEYADA